MEDAIPIEEAYTNERIAGHMADAANLYGMIAPDVNMQETVRNVFFKQQTNTAL